MKKYTHKKQGSVIVLGDFHTKSTNMKNGPTKILPKPKMKNEWFRNFITHKIADKFWRFLRQFFSIFKFQANLHYFLDLLNLNECSLSFLYNKWIPYKPTCQRLSRSKQLSGQRLQPCQGRLLIKQFRNCNVAHIGQIVVKLFTIEGLYTGIQIACHQYNISKQIRNLSASCLLLL